MKIFNFSKFVFRLNVIVVGVTFLLLIPTTHYVIKWYPEDEEILKVIPLVVLGITAVLWLLVCYSIPVLIRVGIFEERRAKGGRQPRYEKIERFLKISLPIVTVVIQIGFLIVMGLCVVALMRGDLLEGLFSNVN